MSKMKMLQDWNYAQGGVNVINYKKGEVYEVDARCVDVCKETKRGEPVNKEKKKEKVKQSDR